MSYYEHMAIIGREDLIGREPRHCAKADPMGTIDKLPEGFTRFTGGPQRVAPAVPGGGPITALTAFNGVLYAASPNGVFKLVDDVWHQMEFITLPPAQ